MNNGYIALLDSGIGGISLLFELLKILPNERYLYLGDNLNAPYGNKNISTLRDITLKNIDILKHYRVKALVVACNTLSVNLLDEIQAYSGVKTFGVFPPIESAIMQNNRCLLLATKRTAENYKGIKGLETVGLKDLALDIENNAFNLSAVSIAKSFQSADCKNLNCNGLYDCVILGCTHYFFVKNKIFDHLKPQKIIFGEKFTAQTVYNFLKNQKTLDNFRQNQVFFIGKTAKFNRKFFNFYRKNIKI